jgi:hypothetical protein
MRSTNGGSSLQIVLFVSIADAFLDVPALAIGPGNRGCLQDEPLRDHELAVAQNHCFPTVTFAVKTKIR